MIMKGSHMRRFLLTVGLLAATASALADPITELNGRHVQLHPSKNIHAAKPTRGGVNLSYHGGPVIANPKVVALFWGPTWTGELAATASTLQGFLANFGVTGEWKVISQYSGIQPLANKVVAWIDGTAPPTNVTDSLVQQEVLHYLQAAGAALDPNAVYEVFLPRGSYASYGTQTSCGGPNLWFCAYHSNFLNGGRNIRYASIPYPSCGGCQSSGWSDAQNFEHFVGHETREAATDPDGTAWYDNRGYEADDKCAWSPAPFLDSTNPTNTSYGYQWEWSNSAGACVQKQ